MLLAFVPPGTNAQYVLALGREATPLGSCLRRGFPHAKGRAEQSNQSARVRVRVARAFPAQSRQREARLTAFEVDGGGWQRHWQGFRVTVRSCDPERSASRAVTNGGESESDE